MANKYSPEIQAKLAKIYQVKEAHEDQLFKLPGVHTISVQPKTTSGRRTTEFAIVVYVARKRPAAELNPSEIVPPIIDGVSTDVIEAAPQVVSAGPSTAIDDHHYPRVVGGAAI